MTMDQTPAFDLLHEGVRRQLWRMGWTHLRPLQVGAIRAVVQTDDHLILSAATAAGKTEAAFLPVLSQIASEPPGSVRALYVGPLKALINDQFTRVEDLCGYLDTPVHRWHGDVGAAAKAKLVKQPSGVLLITPESIESLFVNRAESIRRILGGLRFVVIDELHAFLSNERGLHLRSLLHRIRQIAEFRIIGLSATLGDPAVAIDYLSLDSRQARVVPGDQSTPSLQLKLHAYLEAGLADDEETEPEGAGDTPPAHIEKMSEDIVRHCAGSSNLIFANARSDVELFGERACRLAEERKLPDRFLVHHGSLSADIRVDAEQTMKDTSRSNLPATTFCSSTLEMGIDIGSVKLVGQIGAPYSISGLTQRAGRSGRKEDTPRLLRLYIRCRDTDDRSGFFERLQLELVQATAATLLLIERWIEPAVLPRFDLSTLTQQIISVVSETGGASAQEVFGRLCVVGAFREIDPATFAALLRQLGQKDVLEQTPEGLLILGLLGERIRKDKGFYAVFMTNDAYTVLHDGQKIGAIDEPPPPGQHFILAGRRWKVTDIDAEQMIVYVIASRGYRVSRFPGVPVELHPMFMERMRQVLEEAASYVHLDATASLALSRAREAAARSGATRRGLLELGPRRTALMAWMGSEQTAVLMAMFHKLGVACVNEIAGIELRLGMDDTRDALAALSQRRFPVDELSDCYKKPAGRRKYDRLLSPGLLWYENKPSQALVDEVTSIVANMRGSE